MFNKDEKQMIPTLMYLQWTGNALTNGGNVTLTSH